MLYIHVVSCCIVCTKLYVLDDRVVVKEHVSPYPINTNQVVIAQDEADVTYIYVCMCVCMYVCMYVCTCD